VGSCWATRPASDALDYWLDILSDPHASPAGKNIARAAAFFVALWTPCTSKRRSTFFNVE
jgi:hypothetical protein